MADSDGTFKGREREWEQYHAKVYTLTVGIGTGQKQDTLILPHSVSGKVQKSHWFHPRSHCSVKTSVYKTVLLRYRKRHTARHVASTHSAVLSWWKVSQSWPGGTPDLVGGGRGTPTWPGLGGGYPILTWPGAPPVRDRVPQERTWDQWAGKEPWNGVPPRKDLGKNLGLGYPLERTWDWGTPSGWTHTCENITSPILQMRVVKRQPCINIMR